jgi:hypothetical protein
MNSRLEEGTACFSCENSPEWTHDGGLAELCQVAQPLTCRTLTLITILEAFEVAALPMEGMKKPVLLS